MLRHAFVALFAAGVMLASVQSAPPAAASSTYPDVVMSDSPTMYWRLGESSGSVAFDQTSNHRDGAYLREPVLGVPGAIAGDTDTSVLFGHRTFMRWIPDFRYKGTFTVEAWVRPERAKGEQFFFSTGTYGFQLGLSQDPDGTRWIRVDTGNGHNWWGNWGIGYPYRLGHWLHIVVWYGPVAGAVFVNGQVMSGLPNIWGTPLLFAPGHPVVVGGERGNPHAWFAGEVDEVAVYTHGLPGDRVLAHYEAGIG